MHRDQKIEFFNQMSNPTDVVRVQISDKDLAESPSLLNEAGDHVVERGLLIRVRRAGIYHDHLVAADQVTVGVGRGRKRGREQRAEEYAVAELNPTFQMITLLLRDAEQSLGEVLDALGQGLDRGE